MCSARHGNEISITTRCRASRTTLTAMTDVSVAVAVSISVAVSVSVNVAVFVADAVSVADAALIKAATALCRCKNAKRVNHRLLAPAPASQQRSHATSQPLSFHGLHCRGAAPGTPPSVSLTQLQSCDGDGDGDFKCVRLVPSAAVKSGTNNSDTARGGGCHIDRQLGQESV